MSKNENEKIQYYQAKYEKLIRSTCSAFRMHPGDLETAKLYGLWRFVRTYKAHKSRIKTYLVFCLRCECLRMLNENKKLRSGDILQDKPYFTEPMFLDKLTPDLKQIVEYKFLHKMTLVEIGEKLGVSRETIRNRLKAAKLLLAEDYSV